MTFLNIIISALIVRAIALTQMPGPLEPSPTSLEDFNAPTAEPGRPVPVVFGTVLLKAPNVVWYGDLGYQQVKTGGGK